ncbi:MAG: nucleotide exchange factor GrpE [Acidobacteriota bacterium]
MNGENSPENQAPEVILDLDEPEPPEAANAQAESAAAGADDVQEEMARLQQEVNRLHELYLRKLADFDNYRKRMEREKSEVRRFANADVLRECLPVVDNLERALAAPGEDAGGLRTGVELVLRQFHDVLSRFGVIEVDPLGNEFDPALHEAVFRRQAEDVDPNTVVAVLQKGYLLGEKLLRPALVEVAAPPAGATADGRQPSGPNGPAASPAPEDAP